MTICFSDLETANEEPITSGSYKYAETVRVQLWAYAFDDGPVHVWDVDAGEPMPRDLRDALEDQKVIFCWHNQSFDRIQIKHGLGIDLPPDRIVDTMVLAYMHGLPGSLAQLCDIFKLPEDLAKQKRGKQLVQMFCKPGAKNRKQRWYDRTTHPSEWEEYKVYAEHDILAMREIYKRLPKVNCIRSERDLWLLDQKINDRGFAIDVELAHAAIEAVAKAKVTLADDAQEMTGGVLRATTQRDALLQVIEDGYGIRIKDTRADTLQRLVDDDEIPAEVKALIQNRLEASSTSVGKYRKFEACVSSDGRLRGSVQYCGAARTGRWAGRLVQPQNFPRPKLKQKEIDAGIDALKAGCADVLFGSVTDLAASALRGLIIAPPGRKLVVSDLAAIEGRVTAWLAGEEWRLEGFRQCDAGAGFDDYIVTYAKSFGIAPKDVTKAQRQVGKVMVLMLGYGGNVGAFVTGAATYHLDLDALAQQAKEVVDPATWREAEEYLAWVKESKGKRYGLKDDTFTACNALVRTWRYANPNIVSLWRDRDKDENGLEGAVRLALAYPNEEFQCRKLAVFFRKKWLYIRLPSGRHLCYPGARLEGDRREITYLGVSQYTRQWGRLKTYGGKLLENAAQAVARDVLAHGMTVAESRGYEIVLSVHDELITETPDDSRYSERGLSDCMTAVPPWAAGLPLSAKGFEAYRYKKED
jgi:DNA polymerase